MKKVSVLALLLVLLVSCSSNEDKANRLIKKEMKKTLFIADSYEPVETQLDSAFAPFDNPELFERMFDFFQYSEELEEVKLDIKHAKSSMSIWSESYSSLGESQFVKNEYEEARREYEQAVAREKTLTDIMMNKATKLKKMLESPSEFIGYKAVHSYRAKNNAGQVLLGKNIFFFDPEIEHVLAQYDMESSEYIACLLALEEVKNSRQ